MATARRDASTDDAEIKLPPNADGNLMLPASEVAAVPPVADGTVEVQSITLTRTAAGVSILAVRAHHPANGWANISYAQPGLMTGKQIADALVNLTTIVIEPPAEEAKEEPVAKK